MTASAQVASPRRSLSSPRADSQSDGRGLPPAVIASLAGLLLLLGLYATQLAFHPLPGRTGDVAEIFGATSVFIGATVLCALRAALRPGDRRAWALFALGLLAWNAGNVYYSVAFFGLAEAPFPSLADAGYL